MTARELPPMLALRVLVGVTTGCGLLALSSVALLPSRLVGMELVLTLVTSWAAPSLARRVPGVNARLGYALLVQVAVVVIGAPQLRAGLDAILAPLAAVLLAATATEHTGVRPLVRGMWLGDACLLLAAGVEPDPVLAVPVVLAVTASAGALVAASLARDVEAAQDTVSVVRDQDAPHRPRDRRWIVARWTVVPVVACLAVGLAGGLLLALLSGAGPYGPRGPTAADVLDFGFTAGPTGNTSLRSTRVTAGYTSGELDLRARGDLPDQPLFEVPADSPGLWRSNILDHYDGATFRNTRQLAAGSTSPVLVGTGDVTLDPEPDDPSARLGRPPRTYPVRVLGNQGVWGTVIAPGPPQRLGPQVRVYRRVDGRLWVKPTDGGRIAGYDVTAAPRPVVGGPGGTEGAGPDDDDPRWRQLPDTIPARVRQLARTITAGETDRAAIVLRVERYLRANYTYRLDPPLPRVGQDAVDHFLFEGRTGFCEHFTAAEVVLLRAVGVPARMATGFSTGAGNGSTKTLLASDAHAWVEVWLPGRGWVSSDPTAGTRLAPTVRQWLQDAARNPVVRTIAWALVGPAAVAALLAVGFAVRRLLRRRRAAAPPPKPPLPAATAALLAAFERLEVALRRAGQERPRWETLAALAARLPDPPGEGGATEAALLVLERALYGPVPPNRERARAAAEVLDRVSAQLLAEVQRRREPAAAGTGTG